MDKIFKEASPLIYVEQAAKFDVILNLRTAKAIGLTVPDAILALSTDVIE